MTHPIIKVDSISKRFGGNQAVDRVSIDIPRGSILGLIGPNGSGKTTVLNMLSGELMPDEGRIFLEDLDITGKSPSSLVQLGVTRMFQMTKVFVRLSAIDNLLIAGQALGLKKEECHARADMLIKELTLEHVQYLDAAQLSGGQKKLLEFGMCFMVPPKVALLDEPFAAVHPVMRQTMSPIIKELCEQSVCMNAGKIIAHGKTKDVLDKAEVIEAYLGGDHE